MDMDKLDKEINKKVFAAKCPASLSGKHKWMGIFCEHCKQIISDIRLQIAKEMILDFQSMLHEINKKLFDVDYLIDQIKIDNG